MAKIRKLSNNQVVKDFEPGEILYVRDADDEGEDLVMLVGYAEDGCIQAVFLETAMVHWIELDLKARKPKSEILIYED
ncbi:hypothetical protein [Escherichia coli]|uniref:hypothetical protein n=1 Tax=Escherichia coli TaxID=562 RepID=UPI000CFBA9DD|nr:hypothetical protein [Escherichia coli]